MKYIVGYVVTRPGRRAEFLEVLYDHAVITRQESECVYFHFGPATGDEQMVVLSECYVSEEAHRLHDQRPRERLNAALRELCEHIHLEFVVSDNIDRFDKSYL